MRRALLSVSGKQKQKHALEHLPPSVWNKVCFDRTRQKMLSWAVSALGIGPPHELAQRNADARAAELALVRWGAQWAATYEGDGREPVQADVLDVEVERLPRAAEDSPRPVIHAVRYRSPAFDAASLENKPPVFLLHGYGSGLGIYATSAPLIAARLPDREVYAVDSLGCGLSTRDKWDQPYGQGADPTVVEVSALPLSCAGRSAATGVRACCCRVL